MSSPLTTRFDERSVVQNIDDFAVTEQGMAHLVNYFFIDRDDLWNVVYEDFEDIYPWLDETDFNATLAAAKLYHVSRDHAQEEADAEAALARQRRLEDSYAFIDIYNGDGTLRVSFVDDDAGDPLSEVEFTLKYTKDLEDLFDGTGESDEKGEAFFNALPIDEADAENGATYVLTVTAVPDGYTVPTPAATNITLMPTVASISEEEVEIPVDTGGV